jgi:hypothetical protein
VSHSTTPARRRQSPACSQQLQVANSVVEIRVSTRAAARIAGKSRAIPKA